MDRIEQLLDRVAEVCPLSQSSEKLLALTQSDRSSIPEVSAVIATDPALAAAVMRIANSAVFGGGNIEELDTAVLRIGLRELHDMAAAMSLFAAFRNRGEMLVAFHDRSVMTATIAHRLAKSTGECSPSVAFTSGLLSEIGAMACLAVDGLSYAELFRNAESSLIERARLERERYGGSSYLIGGRFLARNHLPESICGAIATEADVEPLTLEPLARLVLLARFTTVVIVATGKSRGGRADAIVELDQLPVSLRGLAFDGEKLFELCRDAGATVEQSIRSRR